MSSNETRLETNPAAADLVRRGLAGERRALARLITLVENRSPESNLLMHALTPHTGRDHVIGITGATGIGKIAHTSLLVEVPGMSDDIQAIKAGVLEIADILVINKADREGVERLHLHLQAMLGMAPKKEWRVPILKTIAAQSQGVTDLVEK